MSIEKMREEFEAWFEDNKHFMLDTRKVSKGDCFFIWQASRAALVIELPPEWPPVSECDDGANEMREHCVWAIEAAGVKCK